MSSTKERVSKAAEEMAAKLEGREEARLEAERSRLKNLYQGMEDPSGHVTVRRGINWGPSYRTRRKKAKTKQNSNKDSESKA